MGELDYALREFGDFFMDEQDRFFSLSPSEMGREFLQEAVNPHSYQLPVEVFLTKKIPTPTLSLFKGGSPFKVDLPKVDF